MWIKSVEVFNFRVFHGKHRVRIPLNKEKAGEGPPSSFTVIIGENGSGKSVLVDAVLFALFGVDRRCGHGEPEFGSIMNREGRKEGEKRCYVDLELSLSGRIFSIQRNIFPSNNMSVDVREGRRRVPPAVFFNILNNHISLDSAKYLFPSYRAAPDKKVEIATKEAISAFLGIDIFKQSKKNVEMYHRKIFDLVSSNTRSSELELLKSNIGKMKEKRKKLLAEMEKRKELVLELKRDINNLLKKSRKVKGLKRVLGVHFRIQKKIYKLRRELNEERDRISESYELSPYLLIKDEMSDALESIEERKKRKESLKLRMGKLGAQIELIETIFEPGIKTGRCGFCESRIKRTPEAVGELRDLKEDLDEELREVKTRMGTSSIPTEIDIEAVRKVDYLLESDVRGLERSVEKRRTKIRKIRKLKIGAKNLTARYPSLAKLDNRHEAKEQYRELLDRITKKRKELLDVRMEYAGMGQLDKRYQESVEGLYSRFKKIADTTRASMDRYMKKLEIARKVVRAISHSITDVRKEYKEEIEAGLNRVLTGMFSKEGVIDRVYLRKGDYSLAVKIEGMDDETVDLVDFSDGEKVLIYMSLTWALNRLRGHSTLIYDSPFVHLDEKNKGTMVRSLSQLPGQQVVMTTRDDLSGIKSEVLLNADRIYEIEYNDKKKCSGIILKRRKVKRKVKTVKKDEWKWVPVKPGRSEVVD